MLRQNFLSKLLDLSKSSRVFLLLLTVTCCATIQVESVGIRQKVMQHFSNKANLSTQATPPITESIREESVVNSIVYSQKNITDGVTIDVEHRADGIYDVCYKNGIKIWECGPRTND